MDHYYDEVRVDYRVRLNRNFYLEEEPKTVKDAAKVIGDMDKAIDTLEEALEHLKLKYIGQEAFANDEERARQTTLMQIADMVHDNQLVRRLAKIFVSKFANGEPVSRANFLSELQQIEAIVENTSRNRLSLKRWVQSFKAKLRQQFSLVNDDESYEKYVKACGIVKKLYEEYIDYYTWVIKQNNEKISKNPVYSAERSRSCQRISGTFDLKESAAAWSSSEVARMGWHEKAKRPMAVVISWRPIHSVCETMTRCSRRLRAFVSMVFSSPV